MRRDAAGRVQWTAGTLRALFERYRHGESVWHLCREVGCSAESLRAAWRRQGFSAQQNMCPPVETLRDLWERRCRGERTEELAEEIWVSASTLRYHWRKHLGVRPMAKKNVAAHIERSRMYPRAWGLRKAGHSWGEIAQIVGYPGKPQTLRGRVNDWRKRAGVVSPTSTDAASP
jgi:methylphosphotriester-DNA--protein-cysteine methyltransferase